MLTAAFKCSRRDAKNTGAVTGRAPESTLKPGVEGLTVWSGYPDHTGMADHDSPGAPRATPDYPLQEVLELTDAAQYRALFDDTRMQLVSLLLERAATTSELAEALGRPKGTVGHHLQVLADAGLVRVVRTRKVRALVAKFYGRTARVFLFRHQYDAVGQPQRVLARAASEMAALPAVADGEEAFDDPRLLAAANVRYVRVPAERAREWIRRLDDLLLEFSSIPPGGDVTYALVYGLYATPRGALPEGESAGRTAEEKEEPR